MAVERRDWVPLSRGAGLFPGWALRAVAISQKRLLPFAGALDIERRPNGIIVRPSPCMDQCLANRAIKSPVPLLTPAE